MNAKHTWRKLGMSAAALLLIASCARSPEAQKAKFLDKGRKEFEQKNYAAAVIYLKNAVRAMPKDADAYYELGLANLEVGDLRGAIACFRKATELNPKHSGAQLKLGDLMARTDSKELIEEAEKRANDVLAQLPNDAAALNLLAVTELKLGKPESAEVHLEQVLRKSPDYLQSSVTLAQSRLARKDVKGAEQALQQAVSQAPKSPEPLVYLGGFYVSQGRQADAERSFRRALEIKPKYGPALVDLASMQARAGQSDQADKTYQEIALLPEKRYKTAHVMFLFQTGKQDAAVAELERLAKGNPADRDLRTFLVRAYFALNRVRQAEDVLSAALQKNPKETEALLMRARIYLGEKKYSEAERDLNQVLQFRKDSAEAHFFKSKLHQARGENGYRQQELGEALKADPGFMAARIELAEVMIANRGEQQALDLLDQAPGAQKTSPTIAIQRNWAYLAMGRTLDARRGVDQVLASAKIPEAKLQDALVKIAQNDYAGGREAAEAVLQQQPEETRALNVLFQSYNAQKQGREGLQKIREYAARQQKSAAVQQFLGRALATNGDFGGARKAFETAKAANPTLIQADLSLAELDLREGKRKEARQRLSTILSADKDNAAAHYLSAQTELSDGKTAAAIEHYRKILAVDDKNAMALNDLGYLLAEARQTDEALKYAQQAKELAPDNPEVDDTIGWAYYQKGMYSLAVTHLQSAVGKDASARRKYHLAMAYFKAGDSKRSHDTLDAALKADPRLPEAQTARQLIESGAR